MLGENFFGFWGGLKQVLRARVCQKSSSVIGDATSRSTSEGSWPLPGTRKLSFEKKMYAKQKKSLMFTGPMEKQNYRDFCDNYPRVLIRARSDWSLL